VEPIPNPGGFTQETSSPLIRRDAAGIGGAREGMPRQSRILRIASGRISCRQDSHASGTVGALQDIKRENAVQKLSPRIIPRAGWSMLPGRTSHFREEINCPRRFCETAGMPEGIGQRGRWCDGRPPLSGGSKYTMIPDM